MKKITVIGSGNMGSAIISSLADSDCCVTATAGSQATLNRISAEYPRIKTTLDNREAVRDADVVVLAVKPYIVDCVIDEIASEALPGVAVVSVVAGKTIADLAMTFGRTDLEFYRVIPNTAIRLGRSVTFVSGEQGSRMPHLDEVKAIFERSGTVFVIDEPKMEACTALASCGIAYYLRFIRALTEGSVQLGLKPDFATRVAALTAGSAAALLADGSHPEAEIDKVTTPGGLTIRGLNTLEANGFSAAVIAALKASL